MPSSTPALFTSECMSHTKFVVTVTKPQPASHNRPRQQEQLAKALDVINVVVVVIPFPTDIIGPKQRTSVVSLNRFRILLRQIKCIRNTAHDRVECLLLDRSSPVSIPESIRTTSNKIKLLQQMPTIVQP